MRHTLTLSEEHDAELRAALFSEPGLEGAAFLLCGRSLSAAEERFLVREVHPVAGRDYLARHPDFLSIDSVSYARVAKLARDRGHAVIFAHSHPYGPRAFSAQDDREDRKLHEFLAARAPGRTHGSIVVAPDGIVGRVWRDGFQQMDRVRVVGKRWRFHERAGTAPPAAWFDRQVRALGPGLQAVLGRLHVAVVGAGGIGSAVVELLARLGVGELSAFDDDSLTASNVTRVFGSSLAEIGHAKASVASGNVERIGLGTRMHAVNRSINDEEVARNLRASDVVFGCTDRELPRSVLTALSIDYLIPVIDLGVKVSSRGGAILDISGRVSVLGPGEPCLFCRGRIDADRIREEVLGREERARLAAEGYAPELPGVEPAVIPFTAGVAAWGVSVFLERLVGFMPEAARGSETLLLFHHGRARGVGQAGRADCFCQDRSRWGCGDRQPFLGQIWSRAERGTDERGMRDSPSEFG